MHPAGSGNNSNRGAWHDADAEGFYTPDDLAAILKLTRAQVLRRRTELGWPHHKIGAAVRFSQDDLDAIKASTHVTPATPTTAARVTERPALSGQTARSANRRRR